jgi:hypothetical protein
MTDQFQFTILNLDGEKFVTVVIPGLNRPLSTNQDHPNFQSIVAAATSEDLDFDHIESLFDITKTIETKFARLSERVTTRNGSVFVDGDEVNNSLTKQILRFLDEGVDDWEPLVSFMENVLLNPQTESREQLYEWLEKHNFTITSDGYIVCYKGVEKGPDGVHQSISEGTAFVNDEQHTGKIPNPDGATVEMPRNLVRHDPSSPCHVGLHVATHDFAQSFGKGITLEVHVNPRDVVSVPHSSNKMRVCRYIVIGEIEQENPDAYKDTRPADAYEEEFCDCCGEYADDCSGYCEDEYDEEYYDLFYGDEEEEKDVSEAVSDLLGDDDGFIPKKTEGIYNPFIGTVTSSSSSGYTTNTISNIVHTSNANAEKIDKLREHSDKRKKECPTKEEWDTMKARAKRRRRNFAKFATKNGWTLNGSNQDNRYHWKA